MTSNRSSEKDLTDICQFTKSGIQVRVSFDIVSQKNTQVKNITATLESNLEKSSATTDFNKHMQQEFGLEIFSKQDLQRIGSLHEKYVERVGDEGLNKSTKLSEMVDIMIRFETIINQALCKHTANNDEPLRIKTLCSGDSEFRYNEIASALSKKDLSQPTGGVGQHSTKRNITPYQKNISFTSQKEGNRSNIQSREVGLVSSQLKTAQSRARDPHDKQNSKAEENWKGIKESIAAAKKRKLESRESSPQVKSSSKADGHAIFIKTRNARNEERTSQLRGKTRRAQDSHDKQNSKANKNWKGIKASIAAAKQRKKGWRNP